jgi:hypothetical protein
MIYVIGSYAAVLYPYSVGRDLTNCDIDLVASREEMLALYSDLAPSYDPIHLNDHEDYISIVRTEARREGYGPEAVYRRLHKRIGARPYPPELMSALEAITDHEDGELFDRPVKIISPVTNALLKGSFKEGSPYRLDSEFIEDNGYFGMPVLPEHNTFRTLFEQFIAGQ